MMNEFIKVEGQSHLVKNPETGTVLNTNKAELQSARKRKMSKQKLEEEKNQLKNEVQELKSQMSEILSILKALEN